MMGVKLTTTLAVAALAWSGAATIAQAQSRDVNPSNFPVDQPTYIQAFQRIDGEAEFWSDIAAVEGMFGDAIFMFGAPTYKDNDLFWVGKRVNVVYRDILSRQAGGTIIRTQDLDSPFCESFAQIPVCQMAAQPPLPPPPPVYYPPMFEPPARPIPARY